jgi:hypothetical protein
MLGFVLTDGRQGALMLQASLDRLDCSVAAGPEDEMREVDDAVVGGQVVGIGLGAVPVHTDHVSELDLRRLNMDWDFAVLGYQTLPAWSGLSRLATDCRLRDGAT